MQAPNIVKARQSQNGVRNQNGPPKNIVKSFAVSNNGAFSPVNVLAKHASYHNTFQKKIEEKKRVENVKFKATLCMVSSTEPSLTNGYDDAAGQTRSNTLFTSKNWGNL